MRILQVTLSYYPESQFGGQPEKIRALTKGLRERNHEVKVVTTHSDRAFTHQRDIEGIEVQYLSWCGRGTYRILRSVRPLRRLVQWADVVHCYGLYNLLCPLAALWAYQMARPCIIEPLGMYAPKINSIRAKRLYHRIFTTSMVKQAARVVATSAIEIEELQTLEIGKRLVLRRDGVDIREFAALRNETLRLPLRESFRDRHGIGADDQLLLYIGRISPIKNLETLVLAFEKSALKNTKLILAGPMLEENYAKKLRLLIQSQGLSKHVILLGPVYEAEKIEALAAADGFVLPSHFESFGIAAAEAVASGLPVLLTKNCGIAALVHGRAGLAVTADVVGLEMGLCDLFGNSVRCLEITQQSEVIKELSWEQPTDTMEQIYREIIQPQNQL